MFSAFRTTVLHKKCKHSTTLPEQKQGVFSAGKLQKNIYVCFFREEDDEDDEDLDISLFLRCKNSVLFSSASLKSSSSSST
jgi:hypothetical protein